MDSRPPGPLSGFGQPSHASNEDGPDEDGPPPSSFYPPDAMDYGAGGHPVIDQPGLDAGQLGVSPFLQQQWFVGQGSSSTYPFDLMYYGGHPVIHQPGMDSGQLGTRPFLQPQRSPWMGGQSGIPQHGLAAAASPFFPSHGYSGQPGMAYPSPLPPGMAYPGQGQQSGGGVNYQQWGQQQQQQWQQQWQQQQWPRQQQQQPRQQHHHNQQQRQQNHHNQQQRQQPPRQQQQQQQQQQQVDPYTLRIRIPKHLGISNLEHMFRGGTKYEIFGDMGCISFKTEREANAAAAKWKNEEKIVEVDMNLNQVITKTAFEVELIPPGGDEEWKRVQAVGTKTSKDGGVKQQKGKKSVTWVHNTLSTEEFGWCLLSEYASEDESLLAKPFNFDAAAICGSVSSDLIMCSGTPTGHLVFTSVLSDMFREHLAGRTWKGKLTLDDIIVSRILLQGAIIKPATFDLLDPADVQADVTSAISAMLPLYEKNGELPPYYEDMIMRSKQAPSSIDRKELESFHDDMLKQCCFVPFETRMFVVQEAYVCYNNLEESLKKKFDDSAPRHLEDWMVIHKLDKLLQKVHDRGVKLGVTLEAKFADEGSHIRHVVAHAPFKLDKNLKRLFSLEERDMLIWHYYKKYLPQFIKLMYKERSNQPWLDLLCKSYEQAMLVRVTIPRALVPLSLSAIKEDEMEGALVPVSLSTIEEEGLELVREERKCFAAVAGGKEEEEDNPEKGADEKEDLSPKEVEGTG